MMSVVRWPLARKTLKINMTHSEELKSSPFPPIAHQRDTELGCRSHEAWSLEKDKPVGTTPSAVDHTGNGTEIELNDSLEQKDPKAKSLGPRSSQQGQTSLVL